MKSEKGLSICNSVKVEKISRDNIKIDIISFEAQDYGLDVFIRAYDKSDKQIGFGKNGDVDIERIKIVNPPLLVEDISGDVIVKEKNHKVAGETTRYSENHKEALLQVLEYAIGLHGKKNAKVEKGKIGRTSTVVYSNTGGDGGVYASGSSWADLRSQTSGTNEAGETTGSCYSEDAWWMERVFLPFDTSSLPDTDVISAATLGLRGTAKWDEDNDAQAYTAIVESTQASATSLADGDFDAIGSTAFSDTIDITSWATGGFNTFTLNASGIAAISKTGYSLFALREGHDLENNAVSGGISGVTSRMANYTGTTSDPVLTITHAEPAGGEVIKDIIGNGFIPAPR